MRQFTEDRRKFKELILYISEQYRSDPHYGSTLLNKVLFFCDFIAYGKLGQPITGTEYMRETHGPVPRAVRMGPRSPVNELIAERALERHVKPLQGVGKAKTQVTPVPLRPADVSVFSPAELDVINEVIESYRGWKAGPISRYTHQFAGWRSVVLNATIPYETIFVGPDQALTKGQSQFVQDFARRHGWLRTKRS